MKRTLRPKSTAPDPSAHPALDTRHSALSFLALAPLLLPQLLRASSNITFFPAWEDDPLLSTLRAPALTPAASLLCDALSLLGAALLLLPLSPAPVLPGSSARPPANRALILLTLIGTSAVAYHAWLIPGGGG